MKTLMEEFKERNVGAGGIWAHIDTIVWKVDEIIKRQNKLVARCELIEDENLKEIEMSWEEKERKLWELGYWLEIERIDSEGSECCRVTMSKFPKGNQGERWFSYGKDYTEAIRRAVRDGLKRLAK